MGYPRGKGPGRELKQQNQEKQVSIPKASSVCSHTHYFHLSPSPVPRGVMWSRQLFYRIIEAFAKWNQTLKVTLQISSGGRVTSQAFPCPVGNHGSRLQGAKYTARGKMKLYIKQTEQNQALLREKYRLQLGWKT